jgi:hypothetical protein
VVENAGNAQNAINADNDRSGCTAGIPKRVLFVMARSLILLAQGPDADLGNAKPMALSVHCFFGKNNFKQFVLIHLF